MEEGFECDMNALNDKNSSDDESSSSESSNEEICDSSDALKGRFGLQNWLCRIY